MQIPRLSAQEVFLNLQNKAQPHLGNYLAMYSSWFGGIITDSRLMTLPIDDHLVHRGDGAFEALKLINGGLYLLEEHLARLFSSAEKLSLQCPYSELELKEIILATCEAAFAAQTQKNKSEFSAIVRLFLSRGPGSFGPSPYDSVAPQFYCVVTRMQKPSVQKYSEGVSVVRSRIPVKESWFPTVKSCNYLNNVLMKKESVDEKVDFSVSFTPDGFLAESATENIVILNEQGVLAHPSLDYILKGTTMARLFDLVDISRKIKVQRGADISEKEVLNARGLFMVGTTLDVMPVKSYNGKNKVIPPEAVLLLQILLQDQQAGSGKITNF
jgi:branched-chain amino acid aminotransferase